MMKHFLKKRIGASALLALAMGLFSAPQANAELLLNEDFSTCNVGNLYNQNGWVRYSGTPSEGTDILVEDFPLSYAGYSDETAKAAKIAVSSQSQEKLKKQFREKTASTDPVYYAFLMNITDLPTAGTVGYFFSFITSNSNANADLVDVTAGDEHGRVFVYKGYGDAEGTYRLGFSKYSGTMQTKTEDQTFKLNETVLVVCKWVWVDGTTNDYYEFWVNPVKSATEPAAHYKSATSGSDVVVGTDKRPLQGIEIRQGGSGKTPGGHIGAIKVTTSWADLWEEGGDTPEVPVKPALTLNKTSLVMGTLQGMADVTETIVVKGKDLTGDITLSGLTNATTSVTTISKEDAMSEAGYELTVTLPASNPIDYGFETLTFESEGMDPVNVTIEEQVVAVVEKPILAALNNLQEDDYNIYKYTGKATVTFVDSSNDIIYAQDATGGIKISTEYYYGSQQLQRGDKITDIYCMVGSAYGGHSIMPATDVIATVVSTGSEVDPIEVLLSEYVGQKETYLSRVVKITDVTFTDAGGTFGSATTPIKQGETSGFVRSFAGTDLIGVEIPSTAAAIVGIPTSTTAAIFSMRDKNDLVETPAAIDVTTEAVSDKDVWKEINNEYEHSKITVVSTNLKKKAMVYLSGADAAHFSIDKEEIPVGSAETVITVTYKPTAVGTHTAMVTIDATPTELSQSFRITDKAWDPANPPTIIVNADNITEFEANVGQTQEQTISYTSNGLLEYGNVKVESESPGNFLISSSMLMKNGTFDLKITFSPKSEGSFSANVIFTAANAETQIVEVKGKTTGYQEPEVKQGDELSFDMTNPHTQLKENFENAGEKNKPLAIAEWKNVAVTGTRAWWAYEFDDSNKAAKVTPYDLRAAESTPCEMLLLSPALSYENATDPVLAFKVMGQYLAEGQTDLLEVVYVDATNPDEPYYEPIQGLNIPATPDYNDTWVPYIVDLSGQELAEPFFIGFRFKSNRGQENAATYYIDDFSWGYYDMPHITSDKVAYEFAAEQNKQFVTEEILIEGHNLTGDITVSLEGEHADNFTLGTTSLPTTGGNVRLSCATDNLGTYNAVVNAESEGAPVKSVAVSVNVGESGVASIEVKNGERADVYTPGGLLVGRQLTRTEAKEKLNPGIYIFGSTKLIIK